MTRQTTGGWITLAQDEVSPLSRSAATTSLHILEQMVRATTARGDFASHILTVLKDHLGLPAAALFIRSHDLKTFALKAASGLDYARYRSFLLPNPSYLSIACDTVAPSILIAFAPFDDTLQMPSMLRDNDATAAIIIPIYPSESSDQDIPDPLGALCLHVPPGGDIDKLVSISTTVQTLVGPLYLASLEKRRLHLISEMMKSATYERALTPTAERLVSMTCLELSFGAGSLWLLDPRRQQLELKAAFPSIRRSGTGDSVVRDLDPHSPSTNPIAVAYNSLQHVISSADEMTRDHAAFDVDTIVEDHGSIFHNIIRIPLRTQTPIMLGHANRAAVGVLSLTNKFTRLGGVARHIPSTWEDLVLVASIVEVSTALVCQRLVSIDHEADVERRIHGLNTNLIAARDTLTQLEQLARIDVTDPRMYYHLPNAIEWIRETQIQLVRVNKTNTPLRVWLRPACLKAALAISARAARVSARANMIEGFRLDADDILGDYQKSPRILIDEHAFHTILRNLLENSMKYRNMQKNECLVKIWAEHDPPAKLLRLHYADNGIGIPEKERLDVFENGFRGNLAMRVNVQGNGIGLHECRNLMQAMNGNISIGSRARDQEGTEFVLEFVLVI